MGTIWAILRILQTVFSPLMRELLANFLADLSARRADNRGLLEEAQFVLARLETDQHLDGTAKYEAAFKELVDYAKTIIVEGSQAGNKTLWDFVGAKGIDDVIQIALSTVRGVRAATA